MSVKEKNIDFTKKLDLEKEASLCTSIKDSKPKAKK